MPVMKRCTAFAVLLVLAGCGQAQETTGPPAQTKRRPQRDPRPKPARCPADVGNCRAATGRILYVERVDPDGDGDAHFVLTTRRGISLPGVTVIDVEKEMRPRPLPLPGDLVSAAGPVYRGSYGQRQIQATELHVARAR